MTVLTAIAALLALEVLFVAGLTYGFFLRSLRHRQPPAFLRACRERPVVCLALGVATGLASQATLVLTYPLGRLVGRPGPPAGPGRPTVVCLHGLYHNAAAFLALRPALGRAGLPHVLCLDYSSFGAEFETVAQGLLARLRRDLPPDAPLLFLGHSLGGLLARRLAAEPDIGPRTLALVTLGAPHRGSELAVLAVGRLGRGLVPGSPLFATLAALPDPPGAALLSLASPVDNMVIPLEGLALGRPGWREEATAPVSHVAMLYHPAVTGRAAAFLRNAARRAAGPGPGQAG
uniref:Thioesterase domain protein n=1 Tax=Desulfovibrio sp. U5L TaxID=596152 RepID=I2Q3K1_9BACT